MVRHASRVAGQPAIGQQCFSQLRLSRRTLRGLPPPCRDGAFTLEDVALSLGGAPLVKRCEPELPIPAKWWAVGPMAPSKTNHL